MKGGMVNVRHAFQIYFKLRLLSINVYVVLYSEIHIDMINVNLSKLFSNSHIRQFIAMGYRGLEHVATNFLKISSGA